MLSDSLPEGYFPVPYYDLRPYGDRIHPALGQASEFRIFSKSNYDESLLTSGILQALRTNQGFPPEISDGDLFVVDSAVHVGPVVGGGLFPRRAARRALRELPEKHAKLSLPTRQYFPKRCSASGMMSRMAR